MRVAAEHPQTNSTTMILSVIIKTYVFMRLIMKINCYVVHLTYIKWDFIQQTGNCFTVIIAAVYIKTFCIIETLHYSRNLETQTRLV